MENQSGRTLSGSETSQSASVAPTDHGDGTVWTRLDSNQSAPAKPTADLVAPNDSKSTGAAGTLPDEPVSLLPPAPLLSLEDRLLVCLAARGHQRIGQFIENALGLCNHFPEVADYEAVCIFHLSDEEFVGALEAEVFGDGDALGLHSAAPNDAHRVEPSR